MSRNTKSMILVLPFLLFIVTPLLGLITLTVVSVVTPDHLFRPEAHAMQAWVEHWSTPILWVAVVTLLPIFWTFKIVVLDSIRESNRNQRDHDIMGKFAPDYHIPPHLPDDDSHD